MAKASPYETGELTDSIFLILLTVVNPIHGYRIMQEIKEMTQNTMVIGPANMYTTLKKMKAADWITEIAEEEGKILYQITPKGREILLRDYEKRKRIMEVANERMEIGNEGTAK